MAFSGKATDSEGAFIETPEDVSEIISIISPSETPFLDLVGDAQFAATRVFHEWLEESLAPNAVVNSIALGSVAAGDTDYIVVKGGLGAFVMPGAVLEGPESAGGEKMLVTAVSANTLTVLRGFAGTTAQSIGAAQNIIVIAEAAKEGEDVSRDISRPRPRQGNYTQIFKKDVWISDTEEAVLKIGIGSELDHQVRNRTREALRDLEKNVIRSVLSGNTIGGATSVRTMKGLLSFVTTVNSYGNPADSAAFEADVNATLQSAWLNGGTDLDVIMCGVAIKKQFDKLNASRIRVVNDEGLFRNRVMEYENTFGLYRLMMNRWMPSTRMAAIATGRIAIAPLQGRSFHYVPVAKTGDSSKGFLVGEYTMVLRNELGMSQAKWPNLEQLVTP